MRTIEIATPQNVTIRFDLAGSGNRIMAFVLDLIFITIYIWILNIIVFVSAGSIVLMYFLFLPVLFYSLIFEFLLNGATPGKKIMGIKVIKLDGTEPELMDFFGRWSTRILDIYLSFGAIALILVSTTNNAQRLGDILSGTAVVRSKVNTRFTLADILRLQSPETYQAKFPEIRQLSETEMVTIKKLVDRYDDFPNETNKQLVKQTGKHLIERLNITSGPYPDQNFLKALIKDYVILSR